MSVRAVPSTPPNAGLRVVTLAGLAEACALALPVHLVMSRGDETSGAVAVFALAFLTAFTAAVYVLSRFRHVENLPLAVGGIAAAVGAATAHGDLSAIVLSFVASALLAARAARIAFRGRLDPLHGEIAWGAAALGVEAVIAAGGGHLQIWRFPLAMLIPLFFVASFSSRALSVWDDPNVEAEDRSQWLTSAHLLAWCFAALTFLGAALGMRGGGLDRVGAFVTGAIGWSLYALIHVLVFLAQPVFWLFQRIHLNPEALREALERLGDRLDRVSLDPSTGGSWPWARFLGFVVLVLLAVAAYRFLRRIRPTAEEPVGARTPSRPTMEKVMTEPVATGRARRELPDDRIRRWYAEALLALDRSGVSKDGSLTPAEFEPVVGEAFPEAREGFGALTRAYEDVRYGDVQPPESEVRELDRQQRALVQMLRRPRGARPGRT
ncbi:MAG TPA: DUF4129 domain-containing protein [Actinomycetota bacterium]